MTNVASTFETKKVRLANTTEEIVVGGRDKFPLVERAFRNIRQVGVLGWKSQAPAQAQNIRDTLKAIGIGADIDVAVGLRAGSTSFADAATHGFTVEDGTAGDMFDVAAKSDLLIVLIADAAQVELYEKIQRVMKSGATLAFSHGFLLGHMQSVGAKFRPDINVIGMCPKGMGASVRRLYVQGQDKEGAGINSSYAVEQTVTEDVRDIALGWAIATGSPYIFETTLEMEYRSDIFGERAVLLGGVWGMSEAMFDYLITVEGMSEEKAFVHSTMSITGPISRAISHGGLMQVVRNLQGTTEDAESIFYRALRATYNAALPLVSEIYNEVASGREIARVIDQTKAIKEFGWSKADGSHMWRVGEKVRLNVSADDVPIDSLTAGVYIGIMMAQVDVLYKNGHRWSEIANETVIEAVDSLNPYIAKEGIAHMVDNCSTTAMLGGRVWGPRFEQMVSGDALPNIDAVNSGDASTWFAEHPIHQVLTECMKFRPLVDISV